MKFPLFSFFRSALSPLAVVRPGERRKTFFMFLYFFLTISLVYILKPVRSALFIGEFGAEKLPFIYIGEGLWLILVVWAYTRLAKRINKRSLYLIVLSFMILSLVLFWAFLDRKTAYLSAFFYIWVASFSITMTTIFWTLANDIFDPSEAKRLFGIIMSGGSLGGILGGVITTMAVHHVGTENLLLVAAGILICCMFLVLFLYHEGESPAAPAAGSEAPGKAPPGFPKAVPLKGSTFKLLTGSSYLLMLAALVIIAKMCSTVVDAQFSKVVEISIAGKEARTAYFGSFWAWLNGISFLMQFFITSPFLRFLGVGFSLWLLPLGLGGFSFLSLFPPFLMTAQALRIFDGSANYSIQLASKETLYLPLPSELRHRVKPIIDMLGFRSAKTVGGLYILAGVALFRIPYERLGLLVLFVLPLWCWIAWKMKHAYSSLLREYLLDRTRFEKAVEPYDAADVPNLMHSEKDFEKIRAFMNHRSSYARKLAAAAQYTYVKSEYDLKSVRKIVDQLISLEAVPPRSAAQSSESDEKMDAAFLRQLFLGAEDASLAGKEGEAGSSERILMRVGEVLRSSEIGTEKKRQAVRLLEYLPQQQTWDLLVQSLGGSEDHTVRFLILRALNRLKTKNPSIQVNRFLIKSEIGREMKIHDQILKIRTFYRKHKSKQSPEDYPDIALKAIQDESVERALKCLRLLYPGEALMAVHREITARGGEAMRAHALELLASILEPDILPMLQNILEERSQVPARDEEIRSILRHFHQSQYAWFALIAHFLVRDLGLAGRWPELDRPSSGDRPFFLI